MKNLYALFFGCIVLLYSCESVDHLTISNENELKNTLKNEYMKISFQSENLALKNCSDFQFTFDDVEIIQLSKSDYNAIKKGLKDSKLNSLQVSNEVDFLVEYQGERYCMNHLGQMFKNNRKLNDHPELVYLLKNKSNYYNRFTEDDLMQSDTLIRRYGTPFGYHYESPEKAGKLLENDSLLIENINHRTHHNIILTY
ncbi:hypothetical protein [Faecalibacter sp. LW9]|uniref:hypothetical protein n=1 Tax=Faecalibacter sp. LW9 TaxID=3103144 RepID=UPI002AFF29B6|nr:hypothetical protein [Faecalibacter sp. LW9]